MSAAVLELRGVTKAYGETPVLRGIDLTLHEHRAVALIGASGSGKSPLLRCVDLREEIDDGDILLDGEPMTVPGRNPVPFRRRLGFVFQAYNLFPHMDVMQNVVLGAVKGGGMARRRPAPAVLSCSGASASPTARASIPTGCRAASSSGSRSSARSSPGRGRCCSTR